MHATSKEGFFIHNIAHKANPAMHSVWQLNFDVRWCLGTWKGNIKLAMWKNVIYKMKANMKEGLPLKLVNSHGINQPQRKLLACKCKWQIVVIRNELNAQNKGHIIGPFAYDDLSFNDSHREASNNQACPIAQPNQWVKITQQHHWCTNLERQLVWRHGTDFQSVEEFKKVCVHHFRVLCGIHTEEVNLCIWKVA